MTSDQYDSIIQVLRSMNERLGTIEEAVKPQEKPKKPIITPRLIILLVVMTIAAIAVYVGFTTVLNNLIDIVPG